MYRKDFLNYRSELYWNLLKQHGTARRKPPLVRGSTSFSQKLHVGLTTVAQNTEQHHSLALVAEYHSVSSRHLHLKLESQFQERSVWNMCTQTGALLALSSSIKHQCNLPGKLLLIAYISGGGRGRVNWLQLFPKVESFFLGENIQVILL